MGGGFGSKFAPDSQGIICARLAQQAKAPVKLMLDRKEEHLDTGNRPSADARIQGRRDGRRHAHRVRRRQLGHRRRGRRRRNFPLPYIYVFPNRQARAPATSTSTPAQQRADARAGPSAGLLPDRNPDGRARRSRARWIRSSSASRTCRPTRRTRCGRSTSRGREAVRLGQAPRRPAIRRPARSRPAWAASVHQLGRRRPRHAGPLRHHVRRQRRHEVRHAGHRHRHPDDRGDRRRRNARACRSSAVKAEIGDTNYPFSGGSGGSTTAASVSPAIRVTAGKALDALFAKVAPALGVDADDARGERTAASTSRTIPSKGMAWRDACKTARHRADLGRRRVGARACRRPAPSGVQFTEVSVDIETGIVKVKRILAIQDCGLVVDKLTAESQVHGGDHRLDQLRALRGPHSRSRHRPDGEPEHGVLPAGRACPTCRRSTSC